MGIRLMERIDQDSLGMIPSSHNDNGKPEPGNPTYDYLTRKKAPDYKESMSDPQSEKWLYEAEKLYMSLDTNRKTGVLYGGEELTISPEAGIKEKSAGILNNSELSNFDKAGQLLVIYKDVYSKALIEHVKKLEGVEQKPNVPTLDNL